MQQLESLLPPRPKEDSMTSSDHVEEVNMIDYDPSTDSGRSRRGEAYHEDDDDEEGGGPGVQRVQCANQ